MAPSLRRIVDLTLFTHGRGRGGMSRAGHPDLHMDSSRFARLHPRAVAPARDRDREGFAIPRIGGGGRKHLPRHAVLIDDKVNLGAGFPSVIRVLAPEFRQRRQISG